MDACDRVLALDSTKERVIEFIESRMGCVAPNLSAIVRSSVAAKLVASVGGLSPLANMAACNLQLLDFKRNTTTFPSQIFRVGFLEETEIFQTTPPSLRARACRVLAAKSSLAARADCAKADPEGKIGISMKEEIVKKIEKWQEAPPAKRPKPLPVPHSEARKKRGGRRMRKMNERYGMTEMRKMANRMAFGVAEESSLGDGFGHGYGMLTGKLRVAVGPTKLKFKNLGGHGSCLGFTDPVQGMELANPRPLRTAGSESVYFSDSAAFSKMNTT